MSTEVVKGRVDVKVDVGVVVGWTVPEEDKQDGKRGSCRVKCLRRESWWVFVE